MEAPGWLVCFFFIRCLSTRTTVLSRKNRCSVKSSQLNTFNSRLSTHSLTPSLTYSLKKNTRKIAIKLCGADHGGRAGIWQFYPAALSRPLISGASLLMYALALFAVSTWPKKVGPGGLD